MRLGNKTRELINKEILFYSRKHKDAPKWIASESEK